MLHILFAFAIAVAGGSVDDKNIHSGGSVDDKNIHSGGSVDDKNIHSCPDDSTDGWEVGSVCKDADGNLWEFDGEGWWPKV